jgi:hypothetical protein
VGDLMNYLRGFTPWIAFAAVSMIGWQWAALTGLAVSVWLLADHRRAGVAADALILDGSTALYFAAVAAVAFTFPDSGLRHYSGALSLAWLAVTAWATLAVGRPFTTGIARQQAPREIWHSPVFLRVNRVLTAFWAAAFSLTAAADTAVTAAHLGTGANIAIQAAGFAIPAAFTARYPDRVRRRLIPAPEQA